MRVAVFAKCAERAAEDFNEAVVAAAFHRLRVRATAAASVLAKRRRDRP
jgi:hypothetical protein